MDSTLPRGKEGIRWAALNRGLREIHPPTRGEPEGRGSNLPVRMRDEKMDFLQKKK